MTSQVNQYEDKCNADDPQRSRVDDARRLWRQPFGFINIAFVALAEARSTARHAGQNVINTLPTLAHTPRLRTARAHYVIFHCNHTNVGTAHQWLLSLYLVGAACAQW